jgi:hypothetical protein
VQDANGALCVHDNRVVQVRPNQRAVNPDLGPWTMTVQAKNCGIAVCEMIFGGRNSTTP